MPMRFSRRTFAATMLSLPIILSKGSRPSRAQEPADASIGAKKDAFDAIFGDPTSSGSFSVYDFSPEEQASYWVAWDANGFAHRIANDYSALPGGGLPFDPGLLGQSRFLPDDAFINAAGDLTNIQVGATGFYIAQHHSDRVQRETARSGNILVVDQRMIPGDGPNNPNFLSTSIAMETWEINPVIPTGTLPGPGEHSQEWQALFGLAAFHQRGSLLANPPLAGQWMFDDRSIDIVLDSPLPAAEASQWISDMLPTSLGEMTTTYWLPAAGGDEGLRICLWTQDNGMSTVALQVVHGGEEDGSVSRMVLSTIAPATV